MGAATQGKDQGEYEKVAWSIRVTNTPIKKVFFTYPQSKTETNLDDTPTF